MCPPLEWDRIADRGSYGFRGFRSRSVVLGDPTVVVRASQQGLRLERSSPGQDRLPAAVSGIPVAVASAATISTPLRDEPPGGAQAKGAVGVGGALRAASGAPHLHNTDCAAGSRGFWSKDMATGQPRGTRPRGGGRCSEAFVVSRCLRSSRSWRRWSRGALGVPLVRRRRLRPLVHRQRPRLGAPAQHPREAVACRASAS